MSPFRLLCYCRPRATFPPMPRSHLATPAASPPHALLKRRRCCPTARCWWRGDIMAAAILAARNYTTRPAGLGVAPAASPPHATNPRRRCCPTARCWWQGDLVLAALLAARHCTTLRSEDRRVGEEDTPPRATYQWRR